MIPSRHFLRSLIPAAQFAIGRPLPHGRRIEVHLLGGRIIADQEATVRRRGHPIVVESPAPLDPAAQAAVHGAALLLARFDGVVEVAWDGTLASIIDVRPGSTRPVPGISAAIDASGPGRVVRATGALVTAGEEVVAGVPIARLQVVGPTRAIAITALLAACDAVICEGVPTTQAWLRGVLASPAFLAVPAHARVCEPGDEAPSVIEVLSPGVHTTVQDHPGRQGLWSVGVPPSGPMDDRAFRLANELVGNPADAAGLEMTLAGPRLRFHVPAIICLAGPPMPATVDGKPLPRFTPIAVPAGAEVILGGLEKGCRASLAVRGGLAVPAVLGSRATFDLGGFGGFQGRALKAGDRLPVERSVGPEELSACRPPLPKPQQPVYTSAWEIGIGLGPHGAPDFFTPDDMAMITSARWKVHHNSNRTGVRLIGPKPKFARQDGGEAGLHPSNLHDNAYAFGAIDFTGDMPILLGPDGPSLGGFVCPGVVLSSERWKLGQLRPGDTVRFTVPQAEVFVAGDGVIARRGDLVIRQQADEFLLAEVGDAVLDIGLRLRIHRLWQALTQRQVPGIIDLTPGIRSLQVHYDPSRLRRAVVVQHLLDLDGPLPDDVVVPTRTVHLPLSWDDPSTRKAIDIYTRSVNPTAPWCPSNIEFIRRINGLDSIATVKRIVYDAEYLVLGLGDVYLGAPVATPLDPRHRLVTTKYNPARTWTPENAVGIGGAYLCIYGMEGPGGYQFVGRTVPIWNTWKTSAAFQPGTPWLLRFFDIIRWYEVSEDELPGLRDAMRAGTWSPKIEDGSFSWKQYREFLTTNADPIAAFRAAQRQAFGEERARWDAAKQVLP